MEPGRGGHRSGTGRTENGMLPAHNAPPPSYPAAMTNPPTPAPPRRPFRIAELLAVGIGADDGGDPRHERRRAGPLARAPGRGRSADPRPARRPRSSSPRAFVEALGSGGPRRRDRRPRAHPGRPDPRGRRGRGRRGPRGRPRPRGLAARPLRAAGHRPTRGEPQAGLAHPVRDGDPEPERHGPGLVGRSARRARRGPAAGAAARDAPDVADWVSPAPAGAGPRRWAPRADPADLRHRRVARRGAPWRAAAARDEPGRRDLRPGRLARHPRSPRSTRPTSKAARPRPRRPSSRRPPSGFARCSPGTSSRRATRRGRTWWAGRPREPVFGWPSSRPGRTARSGGCWPECRRSSGGGTLGPGVAADPETWPVEARPADVARDAGVEVGVGLVAHADTNETRLRVAVAAPDAGWSRVFDLRLFQHGAHGRLRAAVAAAAFLVEVLGEEV